MLFDEVAVSFGPKTVKEAVVAMRNLNAGEMGSTREIACPVYFTDKCIVVEHEPHDMFFDRIGDPRANESLSQIV